MLIVIDTLRADHLSVYGYHRRTSPSLDRLARHAVVYSRAISVGTWTIPSHASMFTGLLPMTHGAYRAVGSQWSLATPLAPEIITVAERLATAGYQTAAFVGNDTYLHPIFGLDQGFKLYETRGLWRADRVTRRAIRWLERHYEQPFFLFLNYLDPHEPYAAPAPYDHAFPGRRDGMRNLAHRVRDEGRAPTAEELEHCVSQYDGDILYTDHHLGRLLERLRDLGRYRDALIIVTSDHGELLGEHGRLGHGTFPYDDVVRVPLIVKYPGQTEGRIEDRPVSTVDVTPTILDTVGLVVPPELQGVPLSERRQPVVSEETDAAGILSRVIYGERLKLVEQVGPGQERSAILYEMGAEPPADPPYRGTSSEAEALHEVAARLQSAPAARRAALPVIDAEVERRLRALGYAP
jgi:arylsulfatase A-like enzyme